jgi:hypothetical protein
VYTVLWAGAGVRGGLVHGGSDRNGEASTEQPATPADLAATLYHSLGVDLQTEVIDRQGRPHVLTLSNPILDLFA